MKLTNLDGILEFLMFLKEKHVWYEIEHTIDDCLTVLISLPGVRLEVYFYKTYVDYSVFSGDESVEDDHDKLFAMLAD